MRKIREIDDSTIISGPKTQRTSRTLNTQSVATKRKNSIILEEEAPPKATENILIMDHIEDLLKDRGL